MWLEVFLWLILAISFSGTSSIVTCPAHAGSIWFQCCKQLWNKIQVCSSVGTFQILNAFLKQGVLLHLRHPVLQNWCRVWVWGFYCSFVNACASIVLTRVVSCYLWIGQIQPSRRTQWTVDQLFFIFIWHASKGTWWPDNKVFWAFCILCTSCNKINFFLKQNKHMPVAGDISFGFLFVCFTHWSNGTSAVNSVLCDATGHYCNIKKIHSCRK